MFKQTHLIHGYQLIENSTGAAAAPKYQTSTFNQPDLFTSQPYTYTRFGNPTTAQLEEVVASLHEAAYGLVFSSGTAAISNVLLLLSQGDHVIIPRDVYGGTRQFSQDILVKYGITISIVDVTQLDQVQAAVNKQTKLIYMESPSNPLLTVTDISGIVGIARKEGILTVMDNTFMTALNQRPLDLGVDVVIESATKFLNGHSDSVGGMVVTNHQEIWETLKMYQKSFGNILGVEEAWLILRGIKTMGLRLEKSTKNAAAIANFLVDHPKVKEVYYPGLPSHPNHDQHLQQAATGGSVLSFELADQAAVATVSQQLRYPLSAVSLGGVESILSYPWTMSHGCLSEADRLSQGVTSGLLRYSCGIEDSQDLIADLSQALDQL